MAGRGVQTARLNKRTGCESPRCRHCKCRDGLPLVKASHWRIPRRQTGRRSRHKSGDLRKQTAAALPRTLGGDGRFSAQKNHGQIGIPGLSMVFLATPHKSARESDERFFVRKRWKTAGILCVFQGFPNAFLAKKIRQNPKAYLRGVALYIILDGTVQEKKKCSIRNNQTIEHKWL